MLWSLKKVLGDKYYDSKMHLAWVKVYSRMLKIIVPTAVALEIKEESTIQKTRSSNAKATGGMFDQTSDFQDTTNGSEVGEEEQLKSEKIRTAAHVEKVALTKSSIGLF